MAAPIVRPVPLPTQLVDAINGVFPQQPHARAVHAKGVVLEGVFAPSASARTLSRAPHLQGERVDVTVRFSNFSGLLSTPDTDPLASPRGMATRWKLPDGDTTDVVAHSFDGFPTATSEEFRELFVALGSSPPGARSPTALERFLASHPKAKAFLEGQSPPPTSYATMRYFGVNAFKLTNADGKETFARYRFEPRLGEQFLSEEERARAGADYLREEIRKRVAEGPIVYSFRAQIAEAGDVLDDPSTPWPASRRVVELGTLSLERVVTDSEAAEHALLFDPAHLPSGIEPADPMVRVRGAAYPVSFDRREHGAKGPARRR